jgi:hypothetical protein
VGQLETLHVTELICYAICRPGLCDLLVVTDCFISYFIIFPACSQGVTKIGLCRRGGGGGLLMSELM